MLRTISIGNTSEPTMDFQGKNVGDQSSKGKIMNGQPLTFRKLATGCFHSRITEQCFSWLDQWGESRLHIEDPFLLERNLNCVLGSWQEGTERLGRAAFLVFYCCFKGCVVVVSTAHPELNEKSLVSCLGSVLVLGRVNGKLTGPEDEAKI